jgi:hypothetical protein
VANRVCHYTNGRYSGVARRRSLRVDVVDMGWIELGREVGRSGRNKRRSKLIVVWVHREWGRVEVWLIILLEGLGVFKRQMIPLQVLMGLEKELASETPL